MSGGLGLLILLLLGVVLVLARPGMIGAVLGFLALLYFGHLVVAGVSNPEELPLVSVALLLVGELAQWSIDSRLAGRYETGVHLARAAGIVGLGLAGLAVVLLARFAAGLPVPGGIATVAVAVAATVALLGLISNVALRRAGRADHRDASRGHTLSP